MTKETSIKIFEEKKVRTVWDGDQEEWYFSVVDVVEVLTDSPRPRKYWNALKTKLQAEGSELSHNLGQLKLPSEDGNETVTNCNQLEINWGTNCTLFEMKMSPIHGIPLGMQSTKHDIPSLRDEAGRDVRFSTNIPSLRDAVKHNAALVAKKFHTDTNLIPLFFKQIYNLAS